MIKNIILATLLISISACNSAEKKKSFVARAESDSGNLQKMINESEKNKFAKNYLSLIPKATENTIWPRNDYVPGDNIKLIDMDRNASKSIEIGQEAKRGLHLTSGPIVAEDKIFTLGGQGEVQARNISNPKDLVWERIIEQDKLSQKKHGFFRSVTGVFYDSESFLGGNICYSSGAIFITTKRGGVYSISAENGDVIWEKNISVPIRSAPVATAGKLIFTTTENKTYALDSANGNVAWIHEGLAEKSKLSSSPAPLVRKGKVILTYSSGEVYQLDLKNGKEIWSAITSPTIIRVLNPSINDIAFTPVHYKGRIFVVTSDGRLVALDYSTGNTLFEFEGHSITRPIWAVADSIFAVTKFGKLLAISVSTGSLLWTAELDNPEDIHDDKILFSGPVMANGKLFVASNKGKLLSYSPQNGGLVKKYNIPSGVLLRSVIVKEKMFLLKTTDEPELIYFK